MQVAVCEDNPVELAAICSYIQTYCEKNSFLIDIQAFDSGEALLESFRHQKFDVVFTDVVMQGMSGIEMARKIRETDPACVLVFITSSADYAFDAYSVRGRIYVKKPVNESSMNMALNECRLEFVKNSRFITVTIGRQMEVHLPLTGICYVEVYNKNILFHMDSDTVTTQRMTLEEVERILGGSPFLRCHRCYIVNMNHVDKLKNGVFTMKHGDNVPVRKNGYADVQLAFGDFLTEKFRNDAI